MRPENAAEAAETLEGGDLPTANAHAVVEHGDTPELPTPESGPLSVGTRRILGPCGWVDPNVRPRPVSAHDDPDTVFDRVETVGLRGRGRADGETVRVESERGHIEVRAQVTDRPAEGVVFVPMHFADGAVNTLTSERYDPTSGIPEYKVASVRIEPINTG